MKKLLLLTLVVALCSWVYAADEPAKESKATDRVQAAADVLNAIQSAPDSGVPNEILSRADCVAVVPSMLKGGFVVGGKYGRGLASCRTPKGWSAPAFFTVKGGDRKSTRLNSSHLGISYAVFCLKKKKKTK